MYDKVAWNIAAGIIVILIMVGTALFLIYSDKKKTEKAKAEDEASKKKNEELKEDKENLENKIKSMSGYGYEFSGAGRDIRYLSICIAMNIVKPNTNQPVQRSSELRGGITDELAEPGAGLYTDLETVMENKESNERYEREKTEKEKNINETRDYYKELRVQFTKLVDITKKVMGEKAPFLKQLPSDYDEMYNYCYLYINSSDENVRICARGLVSYLTTIRSVVKHM